jgi:hypothetical protein
MTARCITCKRVFEPGPDRQAYITTFYDGTPIDWWVCSECDLDGSPEAARRAMEAELERGKQAMFSDS